MTKVLRTVATDTTTTEPLPPIVCASWCEAGDGHISAGHPDDQYCSALDLSLELARDPEQIVEAGAYFRREATLDLERDPFGEPYISANVSGKLTLDEAEQIANRMLEQVKLSRGESA